MLVNEQVFKRKLHEISGLSAGDFNRIYVSWLDYWAKVAAGKRPTPTERLNAMPILKNTLAVRSDGHAWLFRGKRRQGNPFAGEASRWLGARLGLSIPASGEHRLTLAFESKDVHGLAQPRFLDPTWDYLSLWDWKGWTRPIKGTPAHLGGFEELVGAPPAIRSVAFPVRRIRVSAPGHR